jgi:hypothetical protein
MKPLCVFVLVSMFPFVAVGQQASDSSIASQISSRKEYIAKLKWELDSIIAKSEVRASETLYGEVGGAGGWLSANYEQRFGIGKGWNKHLSWRVGLGLNTWFYSLRTLSSDGLTGQQTNFLGLASAPLMINYFTDSDGSPYHFEAGIGIAPWYGTEYTYDLVKTTDPSAFPINGYAQSSFSQNNSKFRFYAPLSIGYRYQPVDGGFFFKVSAMAIIGGSLGGFPVFPWIGFSFGETYSIK